MPSGSKKVVYAGLAANAAIAASKPFAAAATRSSSLLAEAMHSIVDTCNSLLLLLGLHRSRLPADAAHPFGRGKELYFWSFVVALSMFAAGGVLSVWQGVSHLLHPTPIDDAGWSYPVLGVAALFSAGSLIIAVREANRKKGKKSLAEFVRRSKDPSVFTAILEDSAGLAGELTALLSIYLSVRLRMPAIDGIGSIFIGCLLMTTSAILANETRGLLIGESADKSLIENIRELVRRDPAVDRLGTVLTMQLGRDEVLVNLEIEFHQQPSIDDLERAIDRIERTIQEQNPSVRHVFLEAASLHPAAHDARRAS